MKKSQFKLKKTANINNTCIGGWIRCPYTTLLRLFGKPHFQSEYGTEWLFADAKRPTGIALYHDAVESKNTSYWYIGAKYSKSNTAAIEFEEWLLQQIENEGKK